MKKLAVYLKGYEKESILAPLFKMLEAFLDLFVPLVVANIINNGIAASDKGSIYHSFFLLIFLAILGITCSFTAQYFAAKASVGFGTKLRQALFDHIQSLSYSELDTLGTNTLITRMTSDINQIQTGLNMTLRLLLRSPFIVFGAMIMAFTIDVRCALIFVAAIPVLSVVVFGIMAASIPLFKKVQAALDNVLGLTRENLTGVRVIRAFCKEEEEVKDFDEKNEALTKINERVGRLSALMNPATFLLINIATIILIRQGAIRVNIGDIAQGDVVALYNYMAQMIVELIKLASLIITIDKSIACAGRVANILDVEPGMSYEGSFLADEKAETCKETTIGSGNNDDSKISAITFENAGLTYAGAGAASLTGISFDIKKGETLGIIGGTGSGKSSVVNLIPRFYDATEGSVKLFGEDVKNYAKGKITDIVGVVPQRAVLFKGSIRDNMKWGKEDASDEEIWEAIEAAQAKDVVEGKEGKLDFELEQNGRNLSGGQRQRLTIARALVRKPRILIMDDSASALDFATDASLRKAIRSLEGNMTVVIVSQRTSSIMNADKIVVLDDGQMAGIGTHEELLKSCGLYQEIYYSQFPERRPGKTSATEAGKESKSGNEKPQMPEGGKASATEAGKETESEDEKPQMSEGNSKAKAGGKEVRA